MPREQKAGGGEAGAGEHTHPGPPGPAGAEAHRQDREADRHQHLHRPHRKAVGQLAAGVELAGDEGPAGSGEHAGQQRRASVGEDARCLLHSRAPGGREAAAQGGEVAATLGQDRAEHGQRQAQVLDQQRGVVDAPAVERA